MNTRANDGGAFCPAVGGELLVRHAGDIDEEVDAVQERAGEAALVARDGLRGADAIACRVALVAALARI